MELIVNHTSWCLQNENRLLVITSGHFINEQILRTPSKCIALTVHMGYERIFSSQQKLSYLFLQDRVFLLTLSVKLLSCKILKTKNCVPFEVQYYSNMPFHMNLMEESNFTPTHNKDLI